MIADLSPYWGDYYNKGKESLKKHLEENPKMWDEWTKSDKRYMLICYLLADISLTTGYLDCHISSDSVEDLKSIWESELFQRKYSSSRQNFIADIKERKIVEFLSVCM